MAIPVPLAFPPTSLRAVSAGAVVGNPVGSSGTRAKALTSAELKTIVEASGPAFLPLSGGTLAGALSLGSNGLTCGAITATKIFLNGSTGPQFDAFAGTIRALSNTGAAYATVETGALSAYGALLATGNLALRNGLTAMAAEIFETYTSATNYGSLCLKATASGRQIGSARGSAGGSNRAVQLGHFSSAGAFTAGLIVTTSGAVTFITLADASAPNDSVYYSSTQSKLVYKNSAGTVNVLY